jgi:hypothetical protein
MGVNDTLPVIFMALLEPCDDFSHVAVDMAPADFPGNSQPAAPIEDHAAVALETPQDPLIRPEGVGVNKSSRDALNL